MKVKYEFATESVDLEVEEIWGELLMDMDRSEYNINHKETRRHAPLYEMDRDDSLFPATGNVEDEILRKEEMAELVKAFEILTPEQLALIKKVYLEGKSVNSVAAELGIAQSSVSHRLMRIRKKLEKVLI